MQCWKPWPKRASAQSYWQALRLRRFGQATHAPHSFAKINLSSHHKLMKFGVIVFPGSNCDHDAFYAVSQNLGQKAEFIWHDSHSLGDVDAVILPGGFAYGDYLRCGAIAKFSPVMGAVRQFAAGGGLVMGICNGFQILVEAGLLPGALIRNRGLKFICREVRLETETTNSPFTNVLQKGQVLRVPIAHGEGCYFAEQKTLDELEAEDRVLFRYQGNPNGSLNDIAGILSRERNVMGMMPHPERASAPLMGSADGVLRHRVPTENWSGLQHLTSERSGTLPPRQSLRRPGKGVFGADFLAYVHVQVGTGVDHNFPELCPHG